MATCVDLNTATGPHLPTLYDGTHVSDRIMAGLARRRDSWVMEHGWRGGPGHDMRN